MLFLFNPLRFYVRIFNNITISACTAFLFLVLMEVLLRSFAPQTLQRSEGLFVSDEKTVFAMVPNFKGRQIGIGTDVSVETNSNGLRDREFSYKKPSRAYRILALGDSWTFGNGVEEWEAYPKVLERLLNQRYPESEWEVINTGVSQYGTFNELAFLKKEGVKYNPDLIILGFFPENNIDNNVRPYSIMVNEEGDLISKNNKQGFLYRIKRFIRLHSHLYRFAGDRYHLFLHHIGMERSEWYRPRLFETIYSDSTRRAWKNTENLILQISEIARSNDSKLLILNIPRLHLIYPPYWNKFVKIYQQNGISLCPEMPGKYLKAFVKRYGIPILDFLPLFKKHASPKSLYLIPNGHWSAEGHKVAAQYILEKIMIMKE